MRKVGGCATALLWWQISRVEFAKTVPASGVSEIVFFTDQGANDAQDH
jgi:hypothetical protein